MNQVKVGDYHFTDSDGINRYHGRGCNVYGSPGDALRSARLVVRSGSPVFVWRTIDGLYDWTATDNADQTLPELAGAVLVNPLDGPGSKPLGVQAGAEGDAVDTSMEAEPHPEITPAAGVGQ